MTRLAPSHTASAFLIVIIVILTASSGCNRPAQQKAMEPPSQPSKIKAVVQDGGPAVLTTSAAEFQVLPSGYIKGSLVKEGKNLSLDDDRSALSRLRKELLGTVDDMVRRNHDFQVEVRSTLIGLQARREEASRSTRNGTTFEVQLGELLSTEAQRLGDVHRATGTSVGMIKGCKTGRTRKRRRTRARPASAA